MKKYLEYIVPGLMLAGFALFIIFGADKTSLAGGNFNNVRQYLTTSAAPYLNAATSTNMISIRNATTSYAFATDSSDQVNFNLFTTATSTALDLKFYYEYSDDNATWFPEDSNSSTGGVTTHAATRNLHTWTPGVLATSTLDIAVTNVNSKYMRISFSSWTATSTGILLYAEAILKKGF